MRGTLALWYEPLVSPTERQAGGTEPSPPEVELHFNLWRDLSSSMNTLDIGFLLDKLGDVGRFYLYIPGQLKREHIRDLAPVLRLGSTLNAVFNDIVMLGPETDHDYDIVINKKPIAVFYAKSDDIILDPIKEDEQTIGTRIAFTEPLCARMRAKACKGFSCYLRIRIELVGDAYNLFSSEIRPGDWFFVTSADKLELTELRLNEKRNYPARILELADHRDFVITRVHYFLIRSLQHKLLVQHAPFRKVRRLERDLWAHYLAEDTSQKQSKLGAKRASKFVIYHWREYGGVKEDKTPATLGNFIAFASFSNSSPNLLVYAIVILLLGAAGSSLSTALVSYFLNKPNLILFVDKSCLKDSVCETSKVGIETFLTLLIVIALFVVISILGGKALTFLSQSVLYRAIYTRIRKAGF